MKGIIFDFGGTLDTNGIHWSEKFYDAFRNVGIPLNKEEYNKAYCLAEPEVENFIYSNTSFLEVLKTQIRLQTEYLSEFNKLFFFIKKSVLVQMVSEMCYKDVKNVVLTVKDLLRLLKENYRLGVISNFYGNLDYVLKELKLDSYFEVITDSGVTGYRKPDTRIFKDMISKFSVEPEELLIVGDSYFKDIIPAKLIGCKTAWLDVKSWEEPEDYSKADYIIHDLKDLKVLLEP
ncbi:MAG: HAD family hydrolase [Bacillota bacterium]